MTKKVAKTSLVRLKRDGGKNCSVIVGKCARLGISKGISHKGTDVEFLWCPSIGSNRLVAVSFATTIDKDPMTGSCIIVMTRRC